MFGGAAEELASRPITSSARSVGSSARSTSSGPERICAAGALDQGVGPDDEALVAVGLDLDRAALVGPSARPGRSSRPRSPAASATRSLRYQSSWVLVLNGRAVELALEGGGLDDVRRRPLSVTCCLSGPSTRGPSRRWRTRRSRSRPCRSGRSRSPRRRGGGRAARAAGSASVGRSSRLISYLPPDCFEHRRGDLLDRAARLDRDEPRQRRRSLVARLAPATGHRERPCHEQARSGREGTPSFHSLSSIAAGRTLLVHPADPSVPASGPA